jgi:hypothetical protein
MGDPIMPRWISVKQACKYCSMSSKTLMRYRDYITIVKLPGSRKLRIDRLSLDKLMENHMENAFLEESIARLKGHVLK